MAMEKKSAAPTKRMTKAAPTKRMTKAAPIKAMKPSAVKAMGKKVSAMMKKLSPEQRRAMLAQIRKG